MDPSTMKDDVRESALARLVLYAAAAFAIATGIALISFLLATDVEAAVLGK